MLHAASHTEGPVAPDHLVILEGVNFGTLNDSLQVLIRGVKAALVSNTRIVAVVPRDAAVVGGKMTLSVELGFLSTVVQTLPYAAAAQAIFTADDTSPGQVLFDGTPSPGSTITLYGTW
ncbi:hypothetical protein F183_A21400 [Bryobacterales bacterium F-183]|nr:hypothetical protein F183_A21400 [Bryobacterales bacterium F-183]